MNAKHIIIVIIIGAVGGVFGSLISQDLLAPTQEDLIRSFYETENAVYVSPHSIRKNIGDGTYALVDLRSREEYETAHIIGAVSIPAYATPDKSDYGAVDRIVSSFRELQAGNPGKDIVVYCYSMPCMTGRKIGQMLADRDIYVKHLGIGWQEWRYYWDLWNHDGETKVNPADYIVSGSEPGTFSGKDSDACPVDGGGFGC